MVRVVYYLQRKVMLIKPTSILLGSFILLYNAASYAQTPEMAEHIETVINATPLDRIHPIYPRNAARKGQEGWAKVSFVIDKEGNVLDPIIQDSSGFRDFENATLRAVKQWKYSPAMQNGEPIEQCQMEVKMDFIIKKEKGVTRKFYKQYKQIVAAVEGKNLELAAEKLNSLGEAQLWNHTESGFYWLADAIYAEKIGDDKRELASINRALSTGKDTFPSATLLYLLNRQFVLYINDTQYANALKTFTTLSEQADSAEQVAKLQPYADKLQIQVEGSDPLVRQTIVEQDGSSYHKLSRESFTLHINEGQLDEVQVRCANKRSRFTAAENSEWRIPQAWGQCTLFVTGTPNTHFDIIELGAYSVAI